MHPAIVLTGFGSALWALWTCEGERRASARKSTPLHGEHSTDEIIQGVQAGLTQACRLLAKMPHHDLPRLTSATLTLHVSRSASLDGPVKLSVPGSTSESSQQTHTITIKFSLPTYGATDRARLDGVVDELSFPFDLEEGEATHPFQEVIHSAVTSIYGAALKDPEVTVDEFDVMLSFTITRERNDSGLKFSFATISSGQGDDLQDGHTLLLEFRRTPLAAEGGEHAAP